jgi:hypothetical protein
MLRVVFRRGVGKQGSGATAGTRQLRRIRGATFFDGRFPNRDATANVAASFSMKSLPQKKSSSTMSG